MPKITGADIALGRLRGMAGQRAVELVGQALYVGGDAVRAEASRLITEGSVSGKGHIPSKPGEPPSNDTGHLRTNIEVHQVAPLRVEVSSNARYSAALEFGSSRIAPRPFMQPAAERTRKEVTDLVTRAVNTAIKRAKRG